MIKKEKREKQYINLPRYKKLYAIVLDWIIFFVLSLAVLFGVVSPILNSQSNYQDLVALKDESYQDIQSISTDSKLISINEETDTNYTFDMMLTLYISEHILLSYSYSPENLDNVGFSTSDISSGISEADYSSDYLAYFFTTYMVGKTDEDGEKIIDVEDYKQFYLDEILQVEDTDWWVIDGNELPHLKDDYARYLTEYVILGITYSTISDVYEEFESYFSKMYSKAGTYLLEIPEYQEAYDNYNYAYGQISDIKTNWTSIICAVVFLLLYVIFPLFRGNYQTMGFALFHLGSGDIDGTFKYYNFALKTIASAIAVFFVIGIAGLIFVGSSFFGITLFSIGSSTFTTGIAEGISVLISVASVIGTLVSRDAKDFTNFISGTQDFEIIYR